MTHRARLHVASGPARYSGCGRRVASPRLRYLLSNRAGLRPLLENQPKLKAWSIRHTRSSSHGRQAPPGFAARPRKHHVAGQDACPASPPRRSAAHGRADGLARFVLKPALHLAPRHSRHLPTRKRKQRARCRPIHRRRCHPALEFAVIGESMAAACRPGTPHRFSISVSKRSRPEV